MLYKIYTENKDFDATVKLTTEYFPKGFTIHKTDGHWDGGYEHSIIIDIVADNAQHIYDLAWDIKKANKQKSVLIVAIPCEVKFIQ